MGARAVIFGLALVFVGATSASSFSEKDLVKFRTLLSCEYCDLSGVNLSGESLRGVKLDGADLRNATLIGVDLSHAHLRNASLEGADLTSAILTNADLEGAVLFDSNLAGANFTAANLMETDLARATTSSTVFVQSNLSYATLSGVNLSDSDLGGANLTGARLDGADFSQTKLERAVLRGAIFCNTKMPWGEENSECSAFAVIPSQGALGSHAAASQVQIQLGAFPSRDETEAEWERIFKANKDILEDRALVIQPTVSKGRWFFRLRAGPFKDRIEAQNTCRALQARGRDCLVAVNG